MKGSFKFVDSLQARQAQTLPRRGISEQFSSKKSSLFRKNQARHINLVTQYYPPDFAATGQCIFELAQSLSSQNLGVHVFTSQPGYACSQTSAPRFEQETKLFVWRSRIVSIWSKRIRGKVLTGLFFSFRCFLYLSRPRNRSGIFVFTTAPPFLAFLGAFFNWLFKIKYICLLYDLYPDVANELNVIGQETWISKTWDKLNLISWQRAQGIIVLNQTMKDKILAKSPALESKIHIIHNWADPKRLSPIPKSLNWFAQKHKITETFTVLYSGNLGRCHDMETFFETILLLQNQDIKFVFIGGGNNREKLEHQLKQANASNVVFLPYQEWADLPYSLTACDLSLVSIGKGMEGLVVPSKLYSCLAVGKPIAAICEPHSYLCDLLAEAKCGITVRNGDAQALANYILYMKNSPELVEDLGKNGRKFFEQHFTRDIIVSKYLKVLTDAS